MTNIYYDGSYFDQNSTWHQEDLNWKAEPPRVYRRLHYLRQWSYKQENEIFPGSAATGSPAII